MTISVDRVKSFLWQHVLLLFSLELMTIGVDLCIKSCLGSSVISSIPYILTLAGEDGMAFPDSATPTASAPVQKSRFPRWHPSERTPRIPPT